MIRVLILCGTSLPLQRQIPDEEYYTWGRVQFVFNPDSEYDYVVGGCPFIFASKVPKERCIFTIEEPPMVFTYTKRFLKQYGHVYGFHRNLIKEGLITQSIPFLPWMAGCSFNIEKRTWDKDGVTYNDFKRMEVVTEGRKNRVCVITSNKKMTHGHRKRMSFINKLLENKVNFIDIYGNGFTPISDKLEILKQYKYVLVLENCKYHNYWTEKLADTFLAGAYPIYYGCPNIEDYFSKESYTSINIEDYEMSIRTIEHLLEYNYWVKHIEAILSARELVLDKYNLFARLRDIITEIDNKNPPKFDDSNKRHYLYPQLKLPLIIRIKRHLYATAHYNIKHLFKSLLTYTNKYI